MPDESDGIVETGEFTNIQNVEAEPEPEPLSWWAYADLVHIAGEQPQEAVDNLTAYVTWTYHNVHENLMILLHLQANN